MIAAGTATGGLRVLELENLEDTKAYVGKELGVSDWVTVDQAMIDKFADATGDHQWIHVDVERCRAEMPGGKTIAHGFLTLSLLPLMAKEIMQVKNRSRGINYGSNKVRFTNMVPAGARIRLRQSLKTVEVLANGGYQMTYASTIEIEGEERPALIAENIGLAFP